jgi:nucleoside-diphosphate-sugar epimerase
MKILVTGNMGYVGPSVVRQLRLSYPEAVIVGVDKGFFSDCLTHQDFLPELRLNQQLFTDVRRLSSSDLKDVDVIVHLAAISNDPIGNLYEEVTYEINYRATIALATNAKKAGVKKFIFASSCSVYGSAEETDRTENSKLGPLTAYAKSKVYSERDLSELADDSFSVTCLRFATACGMSERLRLDLVLNDFVAGAVTSGEISILSDGTPWRPLINVKDMARAFDWAIGRDTAHGNFLSVNVGSQRGNYQVKELAETVARLLPGIQLKINKDAQPDKRSYRVCFDLYRQLAPQHQPVHDLNASILELKEGLHAMNFQDRNFRSSHLIRLFHLNCLRDKGYLDKMLEWQELV